MKAVWGRPVRMKSDMRIPSALVFLGPITHISSDIARASLL